MNLHGRDIKIFTGNSHPELAKAMTEYLGLPLGKSEVSKFSDGEINVNIIETVRGSDVFVVQSTSYPVNDHLMELLIMIDAFKRASAGRITAVIPYFGYARQDRKNKSRDPISAKLVADLITTAGADRVLTMDLHAQQIQGFFNIPVDNLLGAPILGNYYLKKISEEGNADNIVVMSPDVGSIRRARNFAQILNVPIAIVDKRRERANVSEVMNIIGDVDGKDVIILDDMVDTGGTLCHAAEAIKKAGARKISAAATHAVLSGHAVELINNSPIDEMVFTDTIAIPKEKMIPKFVVLPVGQLFAEAIARIYSDKPLSPLFKN
ncbi:MAG: ribose-phosphate diphosphokinase [Oscillospiraceae bacterium]|jgi:ribose-phosphate pyrophosphokinase